METEMEMEMNEILIEACEPHSIIACDLAAEIAAAEAAGIAVETFRLTALDESGYRRSVTGSMFWFCESHRAAIEWGADASWTDAASPENAVRWYFPTRCRRDPR